MTLFQAYMATGGVLAVFGLLLCSNSEKFFSVLSAFPRSRTAGFVFWGIALAWFIWHLMTIPEVDLAGFPRSWLVALFGGAGVLAFKFLPDLLSIRGLAVITLFCCSELLGAGFGQLPYSRVLAGTAYLLIVAGLWGGAAPYVWRKAIEKVTISVTVSRVSGGIFLFVGIANLVAGLFWLP